MKKLVFLMVVFLMLLSCEEVLQNYSPIADAGFDEFIYPGQKVTLDGTASFDPENSDLRFSWSLKNRPLGSETINLTDGEAVLTFSLFEIGDYIFELKVDDGMRHSTDQVTITVQAYKGLSSFSFLTKSNPGLRFNCPGTIGDDKVHLMVPGVTDITALVADFVYSGISIKIGQVLQESGISLNDYTFPLEYTLKSADGDRSSFSVSVEKNYAPVLAPAYEKQYIEPGGTFFLDSSGSYDPEEKELHYLWELVSKPDASALENVQTTEKTYKITPDVIGDYLFRISVSDGFQTTTREDIHRLQEVKALKTFSFLKINNPDLPVDVSGTLDRGSNSVILYLPSGHSLKGLIADFSFTGADIKVNNIPQVSGSTVNNFTSPVNYTIFSDDGKTLNYSITVVPASLFNFTLSQESESLSLNYSEGSEFSEDETLVFSVIGSDFDSFKWYIDGTLQNETSHTLSRIGRELGTGIRRISLIATKKGKSYSTSTRVKILNQYTTGGQL